MTTPADVLSRARSHLIETNAGFWTDAELYSWMSLAESEINNLLMSYQLSTATTTVTATSGYTMPSDCLYVHRLTLDSVPLREIDMRGRDALNMPGYGMSLQQGLATHYYRFGNSLFYLWPTPNDARTLQWYYTAQTPAIATASTDFSIPENDRAPILDYVLYNAWLKDQDSGRSAWHREQYMLGLRDAQARENRRRWAGGFPQVKSPDYNYATYDGIV